MNYTRGTYYKINPDELKIHPSYHNPENMIRQNGFSGTGAITLACPNPFCKHKKGGLAKIDDRILAKKLDSGVPYICNGVFRYFGDKGISLRVSGIYKRPTDEPVDKLAAIVVKSPYYGFKER